MPIEFQRKQTFTEKRRATRSKVEITASIRERGRSAITTKISELSMLGCKVDGSLLAASEAPVWIRLPGLESIEARVVWETNFVAGLAFENPLHPSIEARFVPARTGSAAGAVVLQTVPRADNDTERDGLLSRREQIMQGLTSSELSPLESRKRPTGHGMMELISRKVPRQGNDRYETRYADAVANSPGMLKVAGVEAELLNVSPSGLKIAGALAQVTIGQTLPVEFEGFPVYEGRVVWRSGHQAGINLPPRTIDLQDD